MMKTWLAGAAALALISGTAFAQSSPSSAAMSILTYGQEGYARQVTAAAVQTVIMKLSP